MPEPSGFKGTRLGISKINISGATLAFEVHFRDDEGRTHAMSRHTLEIGQHVEIQKAIGDLLAILTSYAETIHFKTPSDVKEEVRRGIGEALGASKPSDEPGQPA